MPTPAYASAAQLADLFSLFAPAFLKWQYAGILVDGMTYPRMQLIHRIAEDGPQIMSTLRDRLGGSARNITVLVDGLEKEGFARRVPHPTDRRATIIELTEEGLAAYRGVYAAHADRAEALFATLSATDRRYLTRILGHLAAALSNSSAAEGRPIDLDPAVFRTNPAVAATPRGGSPR